jgi:hypothetical protein
MGTGPALGEAVAHRIDAGPQEPAAFPSSSCYPFRSACEPESKPTFQQWLDEHYGSRFVVHEFPTEDKLPTDAQDLTAITGRIRELLKADNPVLVVDSSGVQRTGEVRKALGIYESPLMSGIFCTL